MKRYAVLTGGIAGGILGAVIGFSAKQPPADLPVPVKPSMTAEAVFYPAPVFDEAPSFYTAHDVTALAQMLYGEARGCKPVNQAAAVWCVLNRVDSPEFPDTVYEVVTAPNQFHGYDPDNPVWPELETMAVDVLERWAAEKQGCKDSGRVLPAEYVYFYGAGTENRFQSEYQSREVWDWSLPSPYEEE